MEQVTHSAQAPGFYWFQNSCGSVEFLLSLGIVVQAILTPVLVFLLPGPGSIFWGKANPTSFSSAASVYPSSVPVSRALARPQDHGGAISRHGGRGGHRNHWAFDVSEERLDTEAH